MNTPTPPTTAELRAAFSRVPLLHLAGWTFEKAMAVATVRWSLEKSVLARRRSRGLPAQPRLI
jgi:hypothetical protein